MALSKKFTDTIDDAITNAAWDGYDDLIQKETQDYNTRLGTTARYSRVDWQLFKAMVWIESGGPKGEAWKTRPMQIGNTGDPGYKTVKTLSEGTPLVISSTLKSALPGDVNEPRFNIRLGIAYVFARMVQFEFQSILDPSDTKQYEYTVVARDTLESIAKKVGTTISVLQKMNSKANVIHPGDRLIYKKAQIKSVITGWRTFNSATVASRYNVGDPAYAEKIDYCLSVMKKLKRK